MFSSAASSLSDLVIPSEPEKLLRSDYPEVPYWTRDDWNTFVNTEKERGRIVSWLEVLTDDNGKQLSEEVIEEMTQAAYGIFTRFFYLRLDPASWGRKLPDVDDYFTRTMINKFPHLGLCHGNFKTHILATNRFPLWNRDQRAPGHLKRMFQNLVFRLN